MSTSIPHTGSICDGHRMLLHRAGTPRSIRTGTPATAADGVHRSMDIDPDAIRARCSAERARLLEELAETIQAPGQMTYGSQAAAASQVFEQQRDLALRDRATGHLALVDAALARLDAGTYGAVPALRQADRRRSGSRHCRGRPTASTASAIVDRERR